jgi:hypothetical protein
MQKRSTQPSWLRPALEINAIPSSNVSSSGMRAKFWACRPHSKVTRLEFAKASQSSPVVQSRPCHCFKFWHVQSLCTICTTTRLRSTLATRAPPNKKGLKTVRFENKIITMQSIKNPDKGPTSDLTPFRTSKSPCPPRRTRQDLGSNMGTCSQYLVQSWPRSRDSCDSSYLACQ